MAHFARINAQGLVSIVIVADQEFIDSLDNADSFVQCSYNTRGGVHYDIETGLPDDGVALRKNFPSVGYRYDSDRDAFIAPKPYASFILNEETCCWECPITMPDLTEDDFSAGKYYIWDEETHQADNTEGWILVGGGVE